MTSIQLILITIALSIFSSASLSSEAADSTSNAALSIQGQEQLTLGTSYTIQHDDSANPIEINVYLPDSYEKGEASKSSDYPVLYVIDGGKDQDFKHVAGLGALASINPYIFNEVIVVGIKTTNRLYELTSMNTDPRYARDEGQLGGADDFRTMIREIVQPFINSTFRTSDKRIVVGESLAGLFITETLLKDPELFTDYIAVSPSLWYDDRSLAKQASSLLKGHNSSVRNVYLTMADEGGTMQKGLDEVIEAIKESGLKQLNLNYIDRRQNEFHWTIYHDAVLDALRWILPAPQPAYIDEADPWYLIEGANPPGWGEE